MEARRELLDELLPGGSGQVGIDVLREDEGRSAEMLEGKDEECQPDQGGKEKDEPSEDIDPKFHMSRSEKNPEG